MAELQHTVDTAPVTERARKRIGILVVAYNAVTTLSKVLKRIPAGVWDEIEEVAVFDDASQDDTHELALGYKFSSGVEKLSIIKNEKNLGYGGNQKRGYQYFIDKGFDVVVLLHGDGQYAPEILADMYAPILRGEAEAVFGSRMMRDFGGPLKGGMPLYKYVGNRILTFTENRMLDMRLTEFHSGYRAYSLDALRQINFSAMTDGFHFDTEIIVKLQHQGFRIKEIPIPTYYGDEICYVNGIAYAKDVVRSVLRYRRTVQGLQAAPEYAEYHTHYAIKHSKGSSHTILLQWIGSQKDVLEIGCGEGYFAEKIRDAGNRVVGIDVLPKPKLEHVFDHYVSADLDGGLGAALPKLAGRRFDLILMPDILEHLRYPEQVLRDVLMLLKPGGRVLVSVPNVANISIRLLLLMGRFNYAPRGILDRTHLRFYTRRTARRLLEGNGYTVRRLKMAVIPIELIIGLDYQGPLMRTLNGILRVLTTLMPGLLGYQCLLDASPQTRLPE